jgi:hypothetical protein
VRDEAEAVEIGIVVVRSSKPRASGLEIAHHAARRTLRGAGRCKCGPGLHTMVKLLQNGASVLAAAGCGRMAYGLWHTDCMTTCGRSRPRREGVSDADAKIDFCSLGRQPAGVRL